jgi:hypothetical protein
MRLGRRAVTHFTPPYLLWLYPAPRIRKGSSRETPVHHLRIAISAFAAAACAGYQPPPPATPRDGTDVRASFARTWDSVIDEFADRNIPIATIERASGLIATEQLSVGSEARGEADCGRLNGRRLLPTHAIYNVLVRGDSSGSTVKATMRWTRVTNEGAETCATLQRWEAALEDRVKQRAERPAASRPVRTAPAVAAAPAPAEPPPPSVPVRPLENRPPAANRDVSALPDSTAPPPARFTCDGASTGQMENPEDELRRLYVGDLRRNGLVACLEQVPPDLVRVRVGPRYAGLSPDERDFWFGRLRSKYGAWGDVVLELWGREGKFAEYNHSGYVEVSKPRAPRWAEGVRPRP